MLTTRSRQDKFDALGDAMAIRLAKEADDPLFRRYAKLRKIYKKLKKAIKAKYAIRGIRAAKEAIKSSK